jgi:hypothetical protein
MAIKILQYILGLGPFLLLLWYLSISRSLNLFKGISAAAVYIGAALAYTHARDTGLFGLILAVTGILFFLEEVRKEHFREMNRLSADASSEEDQESE